MASAKPLKQVGGEFYEFVSGDTLAVTNGGTGQSTAALAHQAIALVGIRNTADADANVNLAPGSIKDTIILNLAAWTAGHNISFSTSGAYDGMRKSLVYPATGAGTQTATVRDTGTATTIRTLTPGNWLEIVFNAQIATPAWQELKFGAL